MLRALLSYEIDKVKHGKKLIIPVIILIAFLFFNYSIKPLEVLPSFSTTSMVIFAVMAMFGVMYNDIDYSMIESAMLVSMKKKWMLYAGRILMIVVMSIIASVVSILYPVINSILNDGTLFSRALNVKDILSGIILCSLTGITGGIFGLIANKRILHKRELVIGVTLLFVIFTAAKEAIMTGVVMRIIYIIFPPVYDLGYVYSDTKYLDITALLPYIGWNLIFIVIESVVYIYSMHRLKNN